MSVYHTKHTNIQSIKYGIPDFIINNKDKIEKITKILEPLQGPTILKRLQLQTHKVDLKMKIRSKLLKINEKINRGGNNSNTNNSFSKWKLIFKKFHGGRYTAKPSSITEVILLFEYLRGIWYESPESDWTYYGGIVEGGYISASKLAIDFSITHKDGYTGKYYKHTTIQELHEFVTTKMPDDDYKKYPDLVVAHDMFLKEQQICKDVEKEVEKYAKMVLELFDDNGNLVDDQSDTEIHPETDDQSDTEILPETDDGKNDDVIIPMSGGKSKKKKQQKRKQTKKSKKNSKSKKNYKVKHMKK